MKIKPFDNGKKYGWSKLRSFFDFFFPYAINGEYEFIRAEAMTRADGYREFYTFRAFFFHYYYSLLNISQILKESMQGLALSLGMSPELAYQIGAIALDNNNNGASTSSSPLTFSHTNTGSNLILMLGCGVGAGSGYTMSTPTYNSVNMTLTGVQSTNASNGIAGMYMMTAPPTGSNTVSMAFGGSLVSANAVAVSYTGVNQTGQPDAVKDTTGASAPSITVTTVAANCWAACILNALLISGGSKTSRGGVITLSGNTQIEYQDSNAVISPAGNFTFAWAAGASAWAGCGASFSPATANTSNFFHFFPLGH